MRRDIDHAMTEVARVQHGLFSASQIHREGGNRSLVSRRVRSGAWERLSSRVYAFPGAPETFERRLTAAQLHDPETVVSHTAAAKLHRFILLPSFRSEVTTDYAGSQRSPFARVHVSVDLDLADTVDIGCLRVTSPTRTAADLLTVFGRRRVERIVDDLLSSRTVDIDELRATHDRYARGGRPTTVMMREIIAERGPGHVAPGSVLESIALELFAAAGLPTPERQCPLPGWGDGPALADLAWPGPRVIVELDGRRWHDRDAAFERDRERDNAAIVAGWSPLRFTHGHLTHRPGYVVDTVRSALSTVRRGADATHLRRGVAHSDTPRAR